MKRVMKRSEIEARLQRKREEQRDDSSKSASGLILGTVLFILALVMPDPMILWPFIVIFRLFFIAYSLVLWSLAIITAQNANALRSEIHMLERVLALHDIKIRRSNKP